MATIVNLQGQIETLERRVNELEIDNATLRNLLDIERQHVFRVREVEIDDQLKIFNEILKHLCH